MEHPNFSEILFRYWGHSAFRTLQEDIIQLAYQGQDTLALMPTGGGKSICFQVPALAKDGLCLVITPLIALMKDQVENLRKKNIKATAIYSGMTKHQIEIAINNCKYGDYKFLYLSPERITSETFKAQLQNLHINLIAIDEAHCISQWGYDFRPSYLRIAELRDLLPNTPILALTATATPEVAQDIMERLKFRKKNLLQKSFERKNLAYIVRETISKEKELLKIAKALQGTAVVYVRNRGQTIETATLLRQEGISAEAYHGGMSNEERSNKQDAWKNGKIRIIVATNAFGMGIDKPDVRWVLHMELPDSLEAYYQEAGRGGRDEKKAYAILLYNTRTEKKMEMRIKASFPPIEDIKHIYQALGSHLQIPIDTGINTTHDFNIEKFCEHYKIHPVQVYSALQILQRDGYLEFIPEADNAAKLMFLASKEDLYKIQVFNPELDLIIKAFQRAYIGLFTQYVDIDENYIARALKLTPAHIYEALNQLRKKKAVAYIPRKKNPLIIYTDNRLDNKNLRITKENYIDRKERYTQRCQQMLNYVLTQTKCRSQQLLSYFGELNSYRCGQCDVCLKRNKLEMSKLEFDKYLALIKNKVQQSPCTLDQLIESLPAETIPLMEVVRWLLDNQKLIKQNEKLHWHK
ncbi:MAG: RecQ family ATP-dependent DNA helicase [Bacteroidales bacterium]